MSTYKKIKTATTICSFSRSVLEFASVVWSKSFSTYICYDLDNIQYKLLKITDYMNNLTISKNSLISVQNVVNSLSL
jgi:hypothetical protein